VAPVRKEFLDGYKGNILILDRVAISPPISIEVLRHYALDAGEHLGTDSLENWQYELSTRPALEYLAKSMKQIDPPLKQLPSWAELALQHHTEIAPTDEAWDWAMENPAIFRGYHVTDWTRFWPVFFYRFVDPERRSGQQLNYASRIRLGKAVVLSSFWVIYY